MKAIGMVQGKSGVQALDLPKPKISQSDEVLVRVKAAGVDGTDYNMVRHNLQDIAEGRNHGVVIVGVEAVPRTNLGVACARIIRIAEIREGSPRTRQLLGIVADVEVVDVNL